MKPVLSILLLLMISCNRDYASLAKVNGDPISIANFKERLRDVQFDSRLVATEDAVSLKKTILNEMIEEKLIDQECKKLKIKVSDQEVAQALPTEHLDDTLEKLKISKSAWEKKLKQKILAEKLFDQITQKVSEPKEAEIKEFYDTNSQMFQQQEQINIQQIVFQDRKIAEDARNEIAQGQSFEDVAKKHHSSIDHIPSLDLGFIPKGVLPETIEKKVFSLSVGSVSSVLESDSSFYIFKILARKEERPLLWEEARIQIQTMLLQKAKEKHYMQWLHEITLKANIKQNYELLQENFNL